LKDFTIKIQTEQEWTEAWNKLKEIGFKVSRNQSELTFQGPGSYIKHTRMHNYIWSSRMFDDSLANYSSWAGFASRHGIVNKPTFNDAANLVQMDQDLGLMQARLDNINTQRTELLARMDQKKEAMLVLEKKLGIK
jgi:hypothetical protein